MGDSSGPSVEEVGGVALGGAGDEVRLKPPKGGGDRLILGSLVKGVRSTVRVEPSSCEATDMVSGGTEAVVGEESIP